MRWRVAAASKNATVTTDRGRELGQTELFKTFKRCYS